MIPNALSLGSRVLAMAALLLLTHLSVAQRRQPPPSPVKNFLSTQWWLGLRFGVNFTQPDVLEDYYAFSPINYSPDNLEKEYGIFNLPGGQAGLDISFYHKGFTVGLQPTFKIMRYNYTNYMEWVGSGEADQLESQIDVEQVLQVVEVPLIFKYDLIQRGKIRPFALIGGQYSMIVNTQKKVEIEYTDYLGSVPQTYSGGSFNIGNTDRMRNFAGVLGGIGTSLDYANIRTVVEITYLYGLTSFSSNESPYSENELVSIGDVNDKLKINNINAAVSFIFPLRYIDKTFQPY
ncbi:outer membrane beta-barrel protein [Marinoscillum pacificum]|uniref:outer membrane beta-barrel protein n=1 Tax=Marinoscillum pacificum TaxID=392723 RepID=UPI0021582F3F|nr:outer membrane beta-barrel protein [Marinoscillum pacificum]